MKKVVQRISLILLAALLALFAAAWFYWIQSGRIGFDTVEITRTLPDDFFAAQNAKGYGADALYLVRAVESAHPIFLMENLLPDDYEAVRDDFLAYAKEDIAEKDFIFAANKYVKTLRDGHVSNNFYTENGHGGMMYILEKGGVVDVEFSEMDDTLRITDEAHGLDHAEVTAIGGAPTSDILETIDAYFYFENAIDRRYKYAEFARYVDVIEKAGGRISDGFVEIAARNQHIEYAIDMSASLATSSQERLGHDYIVRHEMMGDVFFIDLRRFADGEHINQTMDAMKAAIAGGTRKFIIDLRGNPGGSSSVGIKLLSALGVDVPSDGAIMRISDAAAENGDWYMHPLKALGYNCIRVQPRIPDNLNPNGVFVSVLIDAESYSSAAGLAGWVQDGGFGNIIGSPSRNAPNAFGDILPVTLPYSGIYSGISYTQWLRPNENADPLVLRPDIITEDKDALEAALEFLKQK